MTKQTPKPDILILRGPHTVDAIDEITKKLSGRQVVFMEGVSAKNELIPRDLAYNALSNDDDYIEKFGEDVERNASDFGLKLAWALRGKHIVFRTTDKVYRSRKQMSRTMERSANRQAVAVSLMMIVPFLRNRILNRYARNAARAVYERNIIMVQKIAGWLELFAEDKETAHYRKFAVVVGYTHDLAPMLRQILPDAKVHDYLYDKPGIERYFHSPFSQAVWFKLTQLGQPLPELLVDYFYYYMLHVIKKETWTSSEAKSASDLNVELLNTGSSHGLMQDFEAVYQEVGPIEDYTVESLQAAVKKLKKS